MPSSLSEFTRFDVKIIGTWKYGEFPSEQLSSVSMDEICKLLTNENADILTIAYSHEHGTSLTIEYLTTMDFVNKDSYIITKTLGIYNKHYVPKQAFMHKIYKYDVFMRYFKECLRYNVPEIEEF